MRNHDILRKSPPEYIMIFREWIRCVLSDSLEMSFDIITPIWPHVEKEKKIIKKNEKKKVSIDVAPM